MTTELDDIFGTAPTTTAVVETPPPGVYYNIPAAEYHAWPAISSTLAKGYATLPSTARIPFKPGDDAKVGSGIHAYSLQGQAGLDAECVFGPHLGKSELDKKIKAELEALHPTKTILPKYYGTPAPGLPIMDVLRGVDDSLRNHPKIGPILKTAKKEVSLVWVDKESGCTCKARLDILEGDIIIWDLKKAKSIAGFQWQMKELEYIIQAGFYTEGAIACGLPIVGFGFIPCEAFPPYQVACGYVEPEKLDAARANARRLIGLIKQSITTDYWPNFPPPAHIYDWDQLMPDDLVNVY